MLKIINRCFWTFSIICMAWMVYTSIEPEVRPVVSDFKIKKYEYFRDYVMISGTFHKRQGCEVVSVTAESGGRPIGLKFFDLGENTPMTSRSIGYQIYGPWKIWPAVNYLDLNSVHVCSTDLFFFNVKREVKSHIYSGKISEDLEIPKSLYYAATCKNGRKTVVQNRQGACSYHGGVEEWSVYE